MNAKSDPGVLVQLDHVAKSFPGPEPGSVVPVLSGINLTLHQGTATAILGPSGSGKSTLLQIIGALDLPTSGTVSFEGQPLAGRSETELAAFRNRKVGFVFQAHHLLPQCSAFENVLIPAIASGGPGADAKRVQRARELLHRVGLGHRLDHLPGQLSGGERQRVALVRALINEPRLLLADEPTGALDRQSSDTLATLLLELNREHALTLLVVTHSPALAARMQQTVTLEDGRLT